MGHLSRAFVPMIFEIGSLCLAIILFEQHFVTSAPSALPRLSVTNASFPLLETFWFSCNDNPLNIRISAETEGGFVSRFDVQLIRRVERELLSEPHAVLATKWVKTNREAYFVLRPAEEPQLTQPAVISNLWAAQCITQIRKYLAAHENPRELLFRILDNGNVVAEGGLRLQAPETIHDSVSSITIRSRKRAVLNTTLARQERHPVRLDCGNAYGFSIVFDYGIGNPHMEIDAPLDPWQFDLLNILASRLRRTQSSSFLTSEVKRTGAGARIFAAPTNFAPLMTRMQVGLCLATMEQYLLLRLNQVGELTFRIEDSISQLSFVTGGLVVVEGVDVREKSLKTNKTTIDYHSRRREGSENDV